MDIWPLPSDFYLLRWGDLIKACRNGIGIYRRDSNDFNFKLLYLIDGLPPLSSSYKPFVFIYLESAL